MCWRASPLPDYLGNIPGKYVVVFDTKIPYIFASNDVKMFLSIHAHVQLNYW